MPKTTVNTPDGKLIDVTHPDGASDDQIIGYAQQQYALDPSIAYDPTSFFGAIGETFKGVPRGVANSLISTGEGLFQLADAGLNLVGLEDVIDDEDEDSVLNLARQGREALNESFLGVDQGYQDSFGTKFGEGLGSFFTFLGPGLIGKMAGLSGKAMMAAQYGGAGTLAVGAGAGDQSQRIEMARAQGIDVSPEAEDAAVALGAAIGTTELLPVERLLRSIPKPDNLPKEFSERVIRALKSALGTGTVEAVQETVAGIAQDAVAKNIYDPNTPIGQSWWDDATIGGAVGATADLVVNYAAGRRKQAINQALFEQEKQLREEEAANELKRRQALSTRKTLEADIADMEMEAEEVDVINVQPATVPYSVDGQVKEKLAGGNPFKATAIEISRRLGTAFPIYESFTVERTGAETSVVMDSEGKQYGPEYTDPREAIQLAGALNEQVLEETLEQNNRMVVEESGLDLDEDQTQSLLTLGRQVLGADRTSYNKLAVDYAAGTTAEEGFADNLTAAQAIDAGIKPKDMTASQRINAARLKKGLPETDRFSLSETRKVLGDNVGRLAEFESGASGLDTFRAVNIKGVPSISIDRDNASTGIIKDRPATALEKEQARSAGRRAPSRVKFADMRDAQAYAASLNARKGGAFLPSSDLFGDPDLSQAEFEQLLAAKNIEMDYRSPEMRKIAERFTGRKLRRDQSINDLTKEERQLLFYKMRQLPRFNKPTRVPVFELKPYSPAQLQLAVEYLNEQGSDIPQAGLEFRGVPIKDAAYKRLVSRAREIGTPPAPVEVEESQILALPAPDQRRQAMAKAIQDRLAQMNLGDSVVAKMVDEIRSVEVDAEGNLQFTQKQFPLDEDGKPIKPRGMYMPSAQVLQVSFDTILEEVGPDATDAELERAILGTFNHETIHAIRALDLITQEELELLERASRRYRPSGAAGYEPGETFTQYAARAYADESAVRQAEEAVAELIKYGYQNKLIDDRGNAVKIGGKPRTLMRRIVDFFKNMIGFTRGTEAANFSDFLRRLETGEIGARERGEVRTLYRLEKQAGAVPERGIVAGAYVEPTEGQKISDQPVVMEEADIVEDELEDRAPVDVTKRIPEMTEAAQRLQAGEITKQEYADIVRELKPVTPYEEVPVPASPADAKAALSTGRGQSPEKAAKYGLPSKQMKRGEDAQLRLDIPSYTNHGTWVVSVHRPKGPSFRAGPVVGYESTGAVTDALFGVEEKAALSMAAGKPKGTIATVRGKWSPMSPQAAKKAADEAISDPAWTQVGMDPFRHSYFYDRDNPSMRVVSADEVIQVGPLVLAKNAKTVDALEDEEVLFDVAPRKRVGTTGQYVGAPKGIDTPSKLRTLLNTVKKLAEEGEFGRFWYERSGRQILDLVGGDKSEADKIVQAIAITSPQTPVPSNFQFALQAYYQHKNGEPIRTGMFPVAMGEKLERVFNGVPWEGRKTNNFYMNLMREIDPSAVQGVTTDLWMMRAFQQFNDAPTDAQYTFVENETKRIADRLGWEPQQVQAAVWVALKSRMESKEVRDKTEEISEKKGWIRFDRDRNGKKVRVILDPDNHRKNWFKTAMSHSPTLEEKEAAKFDYKDAAQASLAQSSWESIPSRSSGHMSGIFEAPIEQKLDYHKQMSMAFLDDQGNDIIARELGLASPGAFEAPGYFEGLTSPGSQTQVVLPKKFKGQPLQDVESAAVDLIEAYSAAVGILLKQDGVGYHRPFYKKDLTESQANAIDVDFGRPLTMEEMTEVGNLYIEETGDSYASPVSTPQGVRFINFNVGEAEAEIASLAKMMKEAKAPSEKASIKKDLDEKRKTLRKTNKQFQADIKRVLEKANLPDYTATLFVSYNGYIGNNWLENKNGEGYLENSRLAGRPNLQRRVNNIVKQLAPRIESVENEFAEKYGWSPRRELNESFRDEPDRGVRIEGLEGAVRADDRLSLTHYGRQEILKTDPSRAGTGADRNTKRQIVPVTFFGITEAEVDPYDKKKDSPRIGDVVSTFSVPAKRVYPLGKDPEGLKAMTPSGTLIDMPQTLSNIKSAGYLGFWTNTPAGKVAVISEPLMSDKAIKDGLGEENFDVIPRMKRQIEPSKMDKAVQENLEAVNKTQGPPRFSVKTSPEAQYIGQNPEAALTPDEELYDAPPESPAVKKLTTGPDREQANGKVFMEATNTGPIGEMLTRFKQFALNRYAGLEKYYQKNPMLRELEADSSAIAAALFSDRSRGILASAIKDGVPVYQNGLTKVVDFSHNGRQYRGLIEVMSLIYNKDVGDLRKIAQAYAMVMRGQYLDRQGKVNPVDPQTRAEILQEVDALTDANGYNPVKDWHDVWMAYNDKTIDFLKATGILNEETAEQWKASSYIPFYRQAQGDKSLPKVAQGVFGDLTHLSSFKSYKGSEKAVDVGLIESVALNLSSAIEMGMKNVAQQRIARDMQALGLARQIPLKGATNANTVTFKVNGKPVRFEIDDNLIFDSMQTLGGGAVTDILTKTLGFPSMILRETITRDPGFMVANLLRDTLSTFTTSGANFVPILDSVKGLADGMNRLERVGVVGGYDYSRDPDNVVKFFTDESNRRGIGPDGDKGSPFGMFKSLWRALGDATTASDAATRNAVYNDVLARTGNEAEAAFQAMEIINFSRRGAHPLARVITAAIPFLNARFQGLDVFVRASTGNYSAVKDPRGTAVLKFATRGLLLAGITGLYYMLVSDDDQYKEQSEEVRDNNWLIPTSAGVPVRIPIPFEVGLLFKTIPETIIASTYGDKTAPEVRDTIVRGVTSTLEINPLGAQAVAPIVEASLNHNFFTGREIVPYYIDQKITGGLQADAGTTEMGKYVGQALNISPMKVDHIMFGYTGTLGAYVLNLVDRGLKSEFVQGEDSVLPPAKSVYQFPLWRRFFGQKEGSGLREDAYELYNQISTVVNTANRLKRDNNVKDLNAYLASRRHLLSLKDPVYAVKRKLDLARDQKRKVMNSKLDPEIKRDMIEDIDAQINEYLKVVPRLQEVADIPFIETTF